MKDRGKKMAILVILGLSLLLLVVDQSMVMILWALLEGWGGWEVVIGDISSILQSALKPPVPRG